MFGALLLNSRIGTSNRRQIVRTQNHSLETHTAPSEYKTTKPSTGADEKKVNSLNCYVRKAPSWKVGLCILALLETAPVCEYYFYSSHFKKQKQDTKLIANWQRTPDVC